MFPPEKKPGALRRSVHLEREPRCCSLAFFTWTVPYLVKGYSRALERKDLPKCFDRFVAINNLRRVVPKWERLAAQAEQNGGGPPSLTSILWGEIANTFPLGLFLAILQGVLNCLARPLVLKMVIEAAMPDSTYTAHESLFTILAFGAVVFLEGFCTVNTRQTLACETGNNLLSWMIPLIHYKAMKVSSSQPRRRGGGAEEPSAGKTQTTAHSSNESAIIGNDLIMGYEQFRWNCLFPQNLVGLIAGLIGLVILLGFPCVLGVSVMVTVLMANWFIAKCSKAAHDIQLQHSDARLHSMKEVLNGIQQVKYNAWEEPYLNVLEKTRMRETKYILRTRLLHIVNMTLGRASPIFAGCATFCYMALMGYPMSAPQVFASLAAYNSLRMPLIMLPNNFIEFLKLGLTFERLSSYMNQEELVRRNFLPEDGEHIAHMQDATVGWGRPDPVPAKDCEGELRRFTIANINFSCKKGELVAVVGKVGSGKTTFINALIGATNVDSGTVATVKEIGYVPQKAFVLSGSIQENIEMGRLSVADDSLSKCIEGAAFRDDVDRMPGGLDTEVGERGTTLSGGQQQRLAIARALFNNPALLIVDDALAAVDGHVANKIFQSFLDRREQQLTTIVALNQLNFLDQFDRIVFLSEGMVAAQGSYEDILAGSLDFQELVSSGEALHGQDVDHLENARPERTESMESDTSTAAQTRSASASSSIDIEMTAVAGSSYERASSDARNIAIKLVEDEAVHEGQVSGEDVLLPYFSALGGRYYIAGSIFFALVTYSIFAATDMWLAGWVNDIEALTPAENTGRALGYVALSFTQACGVLSLASYNAFSTTKASRIVHSETVTRLLHAPMSWFESTPSGRILSRFSGDLMTVDIRMAYLIDDMTHFLFLNIALFGIIGYIVPQIIPVLFAAIVAYSLQVRAIDRTNREVKRQTNTALGPVMTLVQETVNGRALIHAMEFNDYFQARMCHNMNEWTRFNFFSSTIANAGYFFVSFIGFVVSMSTASVVVATKENFERPATIGVALGYSFLLPYFLGLFSSMIQMLLTALTSLERVLEYRKVVQDPPWHLDSDESLTAQGWPQTGLLQYDNMALQYRPGLPYAVRNVNLRVFAGEKIGVIGRTGAGKSTLMIALFRLVDALKGRILLDGVDITRVGLQKLRKQIGIIPQHTLLLEGTIQHNLDPFKEATAEKLENVLVRVGLCKSKVIAQQMLRMKIGANESTGLSAGEMQLLTIARVLLRNEKKIIIMDEPTANIDMKTDETVQRVIREDFAQATVITIAHRINTIIDFDRIVIMDKGKVVEVGSPLNLLDDEDSFLHHMVQSMGEEAASALRKKAVLADSSNV
jgi:ABC-type multidrug transport system fused ATPase/permease subunit